ncbi:MAG: hypothetical protein WD607_11255 [Candidatus Paceibacterota bacterium]
MKDIIKKLNKIKDEINSEKESNFKLFCLIARADLGNKWDLLLIADWIKESNSEENLIYIINKIKEEFKEDLDYFSRIVLLPTNERFVSKIIKAIFRENKEEDKINKKEFSRLKIEKDFIIKKLFIIEMNINKKDIETREKEENPIIIKNIDKF